MSAVRTRGLVKRYKGRDAVAGIDLEVPVGAVYGFLGPNGSGKTSTIRVLLGLAAATDGEVELLGRPMPEAWRDVLPRVGALVEGPAFHGHLSGTANLARVDAADRDAPAATRQARIRAALDRVGLAPAGGKRVRAYSLGMRQRLGLAGALLRPRELLLLDEPTNGLDPQGTREVRALVREVADAGATVLLSTHLLAEVEQVCTHVGVMSAGRLVAQGPVASLLGDAVARARVRTPDAAAASAVLDRLGLAVAAPERAGAEEVLAALDGRAPEDVVRALVGAGVRVRGFEVVRPSLEEAFVALTGEGFEVVG